MYKNYNKQIAKNNYLRISAIPVSETSNKVDTIVKVETEKKEENSNQVITELNALHEEKQELQHQINYLEDRLDDCICIKKENKKLKKKLEWCRITVDGLKGDVE